MQNKTSRLPILETSQWVEKKAKRLEELEAKYDRRRDALEGAPSYFKKNKVQQYQQNVTQTELSDSITDSVVMKVFGTRG